MSKHQLPRGTGAERAFDGSAPAIPVVAVEFPSGRTATAGDLTMMSGRPILRQGARGPAVEDLQDQLNELGERLAVDGMFGRLTRAAVVRLQHGSGLDPDGVVGPMTWDVLDAVPGQSPAELAIDDAQALALGPDSERTGTTLDGVGGMPISRAPARR